MRNIKNINQEWFFHKGVTEIAAGLSESGESVSLPHTWNAKDGQDGGNDYFRGTCCYAKKMMRSELPAGEKCFLEINGANSSAKLYVNGTCLAEHDGGYSTWRTDITEVVFLWTMQPMKPCIPRLRILPSTAVCTVM